ncbi:HAMP domain-containing protein, partial [Geodermatophilus sp. SYSU D00766]
MSAGGTGRRPVWPRRSIAVRLVVAMAAVAAFTALLALPVTLVYFERRLPPGTAALVESQIRGGDFDGAAELGLLTALTAGLGALLGLLVARRLARPLQAVSSAARRVAAGDLSARAGPLLAASGRRRADPWGGGGARGRRGGGGGAGGGGGGGRGGAGYGVL